MLRVEREMTTLNIPRKSCKPKHEKVGSQHPPYLYLPTAHINLSLARSIGGLQKGLFLTKVLHKKIS